MKNASDDFYCHLIQQYMILYISNAYLCVHINCYVYVKPCYMKQVCNKHSSINKSLVTNGQTPLRYLFIRNCHCRWYRIKKKTFINATCIRSLNCASLPPQDIISRKKKEGTGWKAAITVFFSRTYLLQLIHIVQFRTDFL